MCDGSHFGGTRDPERVRWLAVADRERKEREDRKEELTALRARIAELEGEVRDLRDVIALDSNALRERVQEVERLRLELDDKKDELRIAAFDRGASRSERDTAFARAEKAEKERDDHARLLKASNDDRQRTVGIFQEAVGAMILHGLDVREILGSELEQQVHRIVELEKPAKGETRDKLRAERDEAKRKSVIDEAQCDEMTAMAGKLACKLTAAEAREAGLSNAVAFLWAAYTSATANRAVLTHNEGRLEWHLESVHTAMSRVAGFDPLDAALAAAPATQAINDCADLRVAQLCINEASNALAKTREQVERVEAMLREARREVEVALTPPDAHAKEDCK